VVQIIIFILKLGFHWFSYLGSKTLVGGQNRVATLVVSKQLI